MRPVLVITGSPSATSRTARLGAVVLERLSTQGFPTTLLDLRTLPAEDLLAARTTASALADAIELVAGASGIVVATPIYKAAYSGLLKAFLDVLPQYGLREKVVLPLATGGSVAHVLAIDYALRPVLSSMDPKHVVQGLFILDTNITIRDDGSAELVAEGSSRLDAAIAAFAAALDPPASPDLR
jgi:FMN reductase